MLRGGGGRCYPNVAFDVAFFVHNVNSNFNNLIIKQENEHCTGVKAVGIDVLRKRTTKSLNYHNSVGYIYDLFITLNITFFDW